MLDIIMYLTFHQRIQQLFNITKLVP